MPHRVGEHVWILQPLNSGMGPADRKFQTKSTDTDRNGKDTGASVQMSGLMAIRMGGISVRPRLASKPSYDLSNTSINVEINDTNRKADYLDVIIGRRKRLLEVHKLFKFRLPVYFAFGARGILPQNVIITAFLSDNLDTHNAAGRSPCKVDYHF